MYTGILWASVIVDAEIDRDFIMTYQAFLKNTDDTDTASTSASD